MVAAQTVRVPATSSAPPPPHARGILLRLVRRHRRRLVGFVVLLVLWQLCEALVPVVVGIVIDRAVATGDTSAMLWSGGALAALFLVLSCSYRFGARVGFGIMQRETHQLRVEIAEHALDPRGAKTTSLTGEMLSLATSDAETVGVATRSFGHTLASLGSVVLSAVVLLRTDLVVGLVVLIGVPVTLGVVQIVTPVISRRSATQQESIARAAGMATDFIRGLRIVKGIGAERVASRRYAERSQRARFASIRTTTSYGALQGITAAASGVFLALVALLAGQRALDGAITIGQLVAVVGLTQFIAEPLGALGRVGAQLGMAYASAGRIATFLGTPRLLHAGQRDSDERTPALVMDAVAGASGREFSWRVEPGELVVIAVDEPAAAGDLVRLLTGENLPASGAVRLGEVSILEQTIAARRRALLVNPHHTDLFAGTLRSNVDLVGSLDPESLDRVLQASAADEVVALHPDGLDQPVTAQGRTFSGGQQQRIALARALASDPPTLVLHDPTSAVDAVTEHRIAQGIRRLRHQPGSDRATLLITTSPAHVAQADRVVTLR